MEWFSMADMVFNLYKDATEEDKFAVALHVVPQEVFTQHKANWETAKDPWTALKNSVTGRRPRRQGSYSPNSWISRCQASPRTTPGKRLPSLKGSQGRAQEASHCLPGQGVAGKKFH